MGAIAGGKGKVEKKNYACGIFTCICSLLQMGINFTWTCGNMKIGEIN